MRSAVLADNTLRELALAVARNNVGAMRPLQEVVAGEGLTLTEYNEIAKNPQFLRYVDVYTAEMKDSGFSFAAKARILAEDLLPHAYHMAKDVDVPAPVRMKAIENLVTWGDLAPKNNQPNTNGPSFSITISLPDSATGKGQTITVDHRPQIDDTVGVVDVDCSDSLPFENDRLHHVPVDFFEDDDYEYAGDDVPEPPMTARTP
jgi:hypothetical protein